LSDSESEEGAEGQVEEDDPEVRMLRQLPSNMPQPTDCLSRKNPSCGWCGHFIRENCFLKAERYIHGLDSD
jgi:hypothetical protein